MRVVTRVVTIEVHRLPQYLRDMHKTMVNLKLEYETAKHSFENAIVEKLHSEVSDFDFELDHDPADHLNGPGRRQ